MQFQSLTRTYPTGTFETTVPQVGARRGIYRNFFKRCLDITLVLLVAPLVVPTLLVIAFVISREGTSPIYWDLRVGRGGRRFYMMKLRTMVPDADALLKAHLSENPGAAAEWARNQKLANDPRITRLGAVLRKTSMDELPQLWNVLKGDMSLVGPRPMMPSQIALYPGEDYYDLRPGVTGPWQVSDRHTCAFAKRAEFDADYNAELSLFTDVKLILRTLGVVLRGTGC